MNQTTFTVKESVCLISNGPDGDVDIDEKDLERRKKLKNINHIKVLII